MLYVSVEASDCAKDAAASELAQSFAEVSEDEKGEDYISKPTVTLEELSHTHVISGKTYKSKLKANIGFLWTAAFL